MLKLGVVLAAGFAALLQAQGASAQTAKPVCTDASRKCLEATAHKYIDSLVHQDGAAIPFAHDVICSEQGKIAVNGEAAFREEVNGSKAITGARNVRLFADTDKHEVIAFLLIDVGPLRGAGPATVHRAERFKIEHGLIKEIELINFMEPGLTGSGWPD